MNQRRHQQAQLLCHFLIYWYTFWHVFLCSELTIPVCLCAKLASSGVHLPGCQQCQICQNAQGDCSNDDKPAANAGSPQTDLLVVTCNTQPWCCAPLIAQMLKQPPIKPQENPSNYPAVNIWHTDTNGQNHRLYIYIWYTYIYIYISFPFSNIYVDLSEHWIPHSFHWSINIITIKMMVALGIQHVLLHHIAPIQVS